METAKDHPVGSTQQCRYCYVPCPGHAKLLLDPFADWNFGRLAAVPIDHIGEVGKYHSDLGLASYEGIARSVSGVESVATIRGVATSSDPHGHHDWHSTSYVDEWITNDATRDEERVPVLRRMVELIPQAVERDLRVLDVGAGYGLLSEQVLDRFPQAWLVCQDFSEPMIAHARSRLATEAHRVDFVLSDLVHSSWTAGLGGSFDVVVSAIAIHNVRHPERIRAIYEEIAGLLAPGGCFLNCDLLMPAPLDEQLEWLRAAGLKRVACFSEEGHTAVFGGFARSDPPTT